jgi:hypothetical protein
MRPIFVTDGRPPQQKKKSAVFVPHVSPLLLTFLSALMTGEMELKEKSEGSQLG